MSAIPNQDRLRRLALVFLSMAHRSDDYLSDAELESVTRHLVARSGGQDRADVQALVMDVLDEYAQMGDDVSTVADAARELADELPAGDRKVILQDLNEIAQADGVVLKQETGMLKMIANIWGQSPIADDNAVEGRWGVLHDLAYIYLVLAHSTDNDLSETETQVILNKLREWQPEAPADDARRMLRLAMNEYAEGPDDDQLDSAIASVRSAMPRAQRMAALNDLVKIANADGVFLDDEEDLINHLLLEWDVDPYANYGQHGDKAGS